MPAQFHGTLVLRWPVVLPPTSAEDKRMFLWFSKAKHEGRDAVFCIAKPDFDGKVGSVYADGTDATVSGPYKVAGGTVVVVASSLIAAGTAPVVPVASLPSFADTVWPALICGGVVSALQLGLEQPGLIVKEVLVKRQETWERAPVEIKCNVVARNAGTAGSAPAKDGPTAVIRGRLVAFDNGHFQIAVHDVCTDTGVVWWAQTAAGADEVPDLTGELASDCWPLPYVPHISVVARSIRGRRTYDISSPSRPGSFF